MVAAPRQRQTALDPDPFRRQVRSVLRGLGQMRSSEAYWATGGAIDQVREIMMQARPFLEAGDGRNALVIYGIDEGFDAAIGAAELGWDHRPLRRAMAGEITELGALDDEAPWYADDLAVARLNVLERPGRFEEYLNLAQAEGQTSPYVTMLVIQGRPG